MLSINPDRYIPPYNVFISYSHKDSTLVKPVVSLMRAMRGTVFFDLDSIPHGLEWRDRLNGAIADTQLVVIFWCHHSCASEEVTWEYEKAIDYKKNVLPLLLDSTPLPQKLLAYQWLDFRAVIGLRHEIIIWVLRIGEMFRVLTLGLLLGGSLLLATALFLYLLRWLEASILQAGIYKEVEEGLFTISLIILISTIFFGVLSRGLMYPAQAFSKALKEEIKQRSTDDDICNDRQYGLHEQVDDDYYDDGDNSYD